MVDKVAVKQPAISTTKKPLTQLTKTPVYKAKPIKAPKLVKPDKPVKKPRANRYGYKLFDKPVYKPKPIKAPKLVKPKESFEKKIKANTYQQGGYLPFNKPWSSNSQAPILNLKSTRPLKRPIILNIPG